MRVDVIPTVDEIKNDELYQKTVIVVDILRTSSTIISALANGCSCIFTAETLGQAKTLKNQNPHFQLAGERFYKKVVDFDFGNSPTEMADTPMSATTIVLTTTNGTRAIQKALKGETILIGSLLNGESCVKTALSYKKDIVLLAAGDRNQFAFEDGLGAGFLIDQIKKNYNDFIEINDFGLAMYGAYKYHENELLEIIKSSQNAKKLIQNGLTADVEFSCQINSFSITPFVNDNLSITL